MDKIRELRKKYDPFWDIDPIELRCGLVETIDLLERTSHYLKEESTDQPFSPFFRLTEQRQTLARFDMLDRGGDDPAPPWPSLGGIEVILTGSGSRVTLCPEFRNIRGDNKRRAAEVHAIYKVMLYTFSKHEMLSDPDLPNRFYRFWHGLEDVPQPPQAAIPQTHAGNEQKPMPKLTDDDIQHRREIVKRACQMRKDDSKRGWKDIARDIGIPERTLRDWRHNPRYQ